MILYGMWSGGVQHCSGTRKDGKSCGNRGYTSNRALGYWCPHHKEQEQHNDGTNETVRPR
jgi:hypothetical protein